MRKLALILLASTGALSAFAQDDDRPAPTPVENLYFATDEFVYIPRNTLMVGFRIMGGAKASFGGRSLIWNPNVNTGDTTSTYAYRVYQDGTVGMDTRTDANGVGYEGADGKTNYWSYTYDSQAAKQGYIAMHNYMAQVEDTTPHSKDPGSMAGMEITLSRDLKQLGSRSYLCLTGGIGVTDLKSGVETFVPAELRTVTDYYSLNGAAAPGAGFSSPGTSTVTLTDSDGNSKTVTVTNAIPVDAAPTNHTVTSVMSTNAVTNNYKVKGAFITMRVGPTVYFPIWGKLHASVSCGFAAVYAGTTFAIEESYDAYEGDPLTMSKSGVEKRVMPGYYFDANLEYWITERTGFYAGASYQSSSDYTQTVKDVEYEYTTKIEFKGLSGMRAGVNMRF